MGKETVLYLVLIAVIFGLIALVDLGLKKLFGTVKRTTGWEVRLPRLQSILGIGLTLIGILGLLYISPGQEAFVWAACWVVLAMGLLLLVNFFWFGIWYDKESFTYRALPHKARTYRYEEITAQQSFAAKNGWNTCLYARGEEIHLHTGQQGMADFLDRAFFAWCAQKGLDPDEQDHDPANLRYFPELHEHN